MKLDTQKKIAARVLNTSPKRVKIDQTRAEDLKEAITKTDIRGLIGDGAIKKTQKKGVSRARANKQLRQKSKGQRKGAGSRKGKQTTHTPKKGTWMGRVRAQRAFLNELKARGTIDTSTYALLYRKAKGGFFRDKKHIKLYLEEQRLTRK
ncbi:50S ribosomal protein L19e [Candidatus Woesearchaeota archaeon]|nr:50S ribosomal protein L19e [Candidatus Woesearchaeota archaeon]